MDIQEASVAFSEIAELLDGLGPEITPETIDSDYIARARYIAECACGKREPFAS